MTEIDFWRFLKKAWEKEGREDQVSGVIDTDDPYTQKTGEYISGHSLLPKNYDKISEDTIIGMGKLLLKKKIKSQTKQAVLIILAHHGSDAALRALETYNQRPDRRLKYFAQFAVDECLMWHDR